MEHDDLKERVKNVAVSNRLVDLATDTSYEDLPAEAIAAARTFLMDTLAVGIAGRGSNGADKIFAAAAQWGESDKARIIGRPGVYMPVASAAFVNGYQSHCLEWDALHEGSVVIAMCAPVSALAAEAEHTKTTGPAFLTALTIAVEIAVLLGSASNTAPRFFRPAVAGAIGAAMGVAKLRGFSKAQTLNTLGLAYSQASGTMQAHWEGSMALAMQVGAAARTAICAADLTEAGVTGPVDVILGKFGFFTLFETADNIDDALNALGAPWKITEMAHKPFPAGRATQATLTMFRTLQKDTRLDPDRIARVTIRVPPLIMLLVGRPLTQSMTPAYARLCLKYIGPLMLLENNIPPYKFPENEPASDDIAALGARFSIEHDGNHDPNALGPQECEIEFTDGAAVTAFCDVPYGSPGNAMTKDAQHEKVRQCFAAGAPDMDPDALLTIADRAETLSDIRELTATLYQ